MKRKLINIIIFFIIIQGIFAVSTYCKASTEKTAKFSVSSATGKVGDEVSIDINLNTSSDFTSTNLILNYDVKNLEYVSYTKGEVLKNDGMTIVKNDSDKGKIAIGYAANPSNEDKIVQPGNILKVVFKLKSNLEKETSLTLECVSLKNKDGIDITNTITNGKIERVKVNNDIDNNTTSDNNNISNNNTTTSNKDNTNGEVIGNSQSQTDFPKAGVSEKTLIILVVLTFVTVILYYKNRNMKEII